MSVKIWEVAGAVRKGIDQVIRDFRKMGLDVKSPGEEVPDEKMLDLAEKYGRKECVFPLVSNESIHELAKMWDEEGLLKLMPEFPEKDGLLDAKLAERVLVINDYIEDGASTVICSAFSNQKPKVFQALYLIGKGEKALQTVSEDYDFQLFLIPKSKEKLYDCVICSDRFTAFRMRMNIEECMILIWADGKYYCEPAEFKRVKDRYYLDIERNLEKYRVSLPQMVKQQWNPRGVWKMCVYVQPGKNGFAIQDVVLWKKHYHGGKRASCKILFDKSKIISADGEIRDYFWNTDEKAMTIRDNQVMRREISDLLESDVYSVHRRPFWL